MEQRAVFKSNRSWDSWFEGGDVSADFMTSRDQPDEQERDAF